MSTKDIWSIIGGDIAGLATIGLTDPSFVKWVLFVGILAMIGFLWLSRGKSRVSLYGSNLAMALTASIHYIY